jgi:hypothetical protein
VALRSRGAQGLSDRTAQDLQPWQAACERQKAAAVADVLEAGDDPSTRRVEVAMEGVMAHLDGRWQEAQGGTTLVRRLAVQAEEPTLGALLARRDVGVLGSAEDLAIRLPQVLRQAGWERLPRGAIVGDGAPWMWTAADAHGPGVRQTLDDAHLSAPRDGCAHRLYPNHPAGAKAWVDQQRGARLTARRGDVLGALQRPRLWNTALCNALAQRRGSSARHRTRIRSQAPWQQGLAVGSSAVEGACQHVLHRRFTRAGMRWNQPAVLHVLAGRIARLHGTFQAFWASRGLVIQAPV